MYMLDTNICIYIMKQHPSAVRDRITGIPPREVMISGIVLAELWYGVSKSAQRQRNEMALSDFLAVCGVEEWPTQAAPLYGDLRASLERRGRIIGGNDLLIASHALLRKATLVTNNTREFERVPGLMVENWVE